MPHDPVTTRHVVVPKEAGSDHDSIVMDNYLAPGDFEEIGDPFYEADKALKHKVRAYLTTRFPMGYEWCVESDLKQGVVKFSIPILMGILNWWVINLHKTELDRGVLMGAGEILERYVLPRDRYDRDRFLEARGRHSALVVASRPVPG